ncbi:MAG: BadF/BadG/BcrA/BcrD ATPase family protein [Peptoniphilaceae bacterium]|nr:BadF/BadG/BcrA/BcrD ATPase family protein [Peptoniphilaceae bacterium]MDY6018262.1 BadF/BadG/BcrA/BcrD ATPase family protein [Anaerococcus sp.]
MKNVFLGVDGGGTKTAFLLEKDGEKFESIEKTIHPMQASKEEFRDRIKAGIKAVVAKAGLDISDIAYTFVAVPGFGQYPETEAYIFATIEDILGSKNFEVGNDCLNAWAGSLNAKEGINLILGTGSIGYGRDNHGNSARCGGWGPFLGDEASGYYIGKMILNYFTKMSDGRMEKTYLYDLLKEELDFENDMDIITISEKMQREDIASLSKLLSKALEKEDPKALEIIDDIAKEASLVIRALIDELSFDSKVKVSYSGGVYKLGEVLIDQIKSYLNDDVDLVEPLYSPVEGSLILAKKIYENGSF